MPKVSSAHMGARREQILEAANACFARRGIFRTSVDEICTEAGMSKGALYTHFDSKDAIIAAAAERDAARGAGIFQEAVASSAGPGDALDRLAHLYSTYLVEGRSPLIAGRHIFETYAAELDSPVVRASQQKIRMTYRRVTTELIREAITGGDIQTELPPESVATLLIALMEGLRILYTLYPDWVDAAAVPPFVRRAIGRECCRGTA